MWFKSRSEDKSTFKSWLPTSSIQEIIKQNYKGSHSITFHLIDGQQRRVRVEGNWLKVNFIYYTQIYPKLIESKIRFTIGVAIGILITKLLGF